MLHGSLEKLGRLADRCERVNSRLEQIVTENHRILDNSFLASQVQRQNRPEASLHVWVVEYDFFRAACRS